MENEKILSESKRLLVKVTECLKANQPTGDMKNGDSAVILLATLSELVSNCLLNIAVTYALVNKKDVEDELADFKKGFFSSVELSLDSADLVHAKAIIALAMLNAASEHKIRTNLEAEFQMNDNNPKKATSTHGPWSYPIKEIES